MKPESAIRRHRDDLRAIALLPCGCRSSGHEPECIRGRYMMLAVETTLSWLLGEDDDYQRVVSEMRERVAGVIEGN